MKIVIVGDTHGDLSRMENVYLREQDADAFLHAGDVEAPSSSIAPFCAVRGNCDGFYQEYPFSRDIHTPFGILRIEHRPIVSSAMLMSMKIDGVRIFVHGHTHVREEREDNGIFIFSPGSLVYPRDNDRGTYLVLEICEDGLTAAFKEY